VCNLHRQILSGFYPFPYSQWYVKIGILIAILAALILGV